MKILEQRANTVCRNLRDRGVLRRMPPETSQWRVNLASNDYLGVVRNGLLRPALARHAERLGTGGASSRLVFGTSAHHRRLEEKLAEHFGYEAALVFTSGFMANYGLCASIKEVADAVFIDKRVHASVVDGLMQPLGGTVPFHSFKHNDAGHFRELAARRNGSESVVTITESLFSMTGRICRREVLAEAGGRGFLIVDEAHAVGACAPCGRALFGREAGVDVTVGTFGKAFGCQGGFILCSHDMREFFINRCRSFIFTTALPEVYAAVGADAIDLVAGMDEEREKLSGLAATLSGELISAGFRITGDAHILAVYCNGAENALALSHRLARHGIALYAVRPPTVPPREILLRVSLNATLTPEDLDFFLETLTNLRAELPESFAPPLPAQG